LSDELDDLSDDWSGLFAILGKSFLRWASDLSFLVQCLAVTSSARHDAACGGDVQWPMSLDERLKLCAARGEVSLTILPSTNTPHVTALYDQPHAATRPLSPWPMQPALAQDSIAPLFIAFARDASYIHLSLRRFFRAAT